MTDLGDAVGAEGLFAVSMEAGDLDLARAIDGFGALCDRAADRGLWVAIEFLPWSSIPNLTTARAIVEGAARDNGGLVVDAWHFTRSGSRLADVTEVAGFVRDFQICDTAPGAEADLMDECMHRRLLPGEGTADVVGLVRALDAGGAWCPTAIQVFSDELEQLGPIEATMRAAEATRRILAEARNARGSSSWATCDGRSATSRSRASSRAWRPYHPRGCSRRARRKASLRNASWLRPHFLDDDGNFVLSIHALCVESAGPQDRRRHVHRQRPSDPGLRVPAGRHAVPPEPGRRGLPSRRGRLRRLHAPALRPRGLEHHARRRRVGADLPERPLHHLPGGVGVLLDRRRRRLRAHPRRRGAGRHRRRARGSRAARPQGHRRHLARAHARPHARARRRPHRVER